MYVYFDSNGTIKEVVNDKSIRKGNVDANRIYAYIDGNPEIDDIWIVSKKPDGTLTTEVSFIDNVITKTIPYDAKRDLTHFKDFTEYKFYYFDFSTLMQGLWVSTIRIVKNNEIFALGELTFNVQENVIKEDNNITESQYQYLLLAYADRTLNEQAGADLDGVIQNKINIASGVAYNELESQIQEHLAEQDETIAGLGQLRPSGVATSSQILAFTEDKGIYISSTNGHWYYWDATLSTPAYKDSGMTFSYDFSNIWIVDESQLTQYDGGKYQITDVSVASQINSKNVFMIKVQLKYNGEELSSDTTVETFYMVNSDAEDVEDIVYRTLPTFDGGKISFKELILENISGTSNFTINFVTELDSSWYVAYTSTEINYGENLEITADDLTYDSQTEIEGDTVTIFRLTNQAKANKMINGHVNTIYSNLAYVNGNLNTTNTYIYLHLNDCITITSIRTTKMYSKASMYYDFQGLNYTIKIAYDYQNVAIDNGEVYLSFTGSKFFRRISS